MHPSLYYYSKNCMLQIQNHCFRLCVVPLCTLKYEEQERNTVNTMMSTEKVNCVAQTIAEWVMPHSQSENILLICFACAFFDRLYFYNSVHQRRSFSLVPEKGMFCLIQDLRVWQDYCEALDVTSLLFQKPVQFPLNHEATSTNNK